MNEYIMISIAVAAGVSVAIFIMWLIYRRGLGVRMSVMTVLMVGFVALVAFSIGKEGITVGRVLIALAIVLPLVIGVLYLMMRQVVNPIRKLTEVTKK